MDSDDRDRLTIDSIAQLMYGPSSSYIVGVVAYNTDVIAAQGMADSRSRDSIMKAADSVRYTGYTSTGTGLTRALGLLDTAEASEKTVAMLSDGEIVVQDDAAITVFSGQFENAVTETKNSGVAIHVIGLGVDVENKVSMVFSASVEAGGANYHASKVEDIQQAVDSVLSEQLSIKKTTAVVVDADSGTEKLDVTTPTANVTNARLLFISDSPTRNLNADFSAGSVRQVSGTHYTLLKLDHPSAEEVYVSLQGAVGSQVKVDVIIEYRIILMPGIVCKDTKPVNEDTISYDRTAQISVALYGAESPKRQVLIDSVFGGRSLAGVVDRQAWSRVICVGSVALLP